MKITVYSTNWCMDCMKSKRFMDSKGIKYEDINIEEKPEFVEVVMKINDGIQSVPTIVVELDNGEKKILVEPTNDELSTALNIK